MSNYDIMVTGSADSEASEEQKREKISELRKKEQEIQEVLAKKTKELRKICLREAVRRHTLCCPFCSRDARNSWQAFRAPAHAGANTFLHAVPFRQTIILDHCLVFVRSASSQQSTIGVDY